MERLYIVATFLMNVRTTFYGNQFTHALNHELRMTVEELLAMADP
jgi:predicted branched-subunit amino acid permease